MIGFYNVSVLLTYAGLVSAILGMARALAGDIRFAVLCLMFCGLCDMFDGTIARKCKRTPEAKCFGMQIDSLCDLVCFGVFPAILGYGIGLKDWVNVLCMAYYVLAAVIRLGYFNVQEIMNADGGKREYYIGLPVTSVALIMPMILLIDAMSRYQIVQFYSVALTLLGTAFVSRIKVKKPYMVGLSVLAAIGLVVFVLVWHYGGDITCLSGSIASA